ncbi:MAG: type II toxin-antitoxin system HicA family toxin [Nitrospinae bacterium]|nr:type II toxin-antitoxin system HicA family toxin [Nitrospinota bacterium]MCH8931753.1 type II toxin-antitoxin system HicA family toxin [Nitrospinota bacterium]
MLRNSRQLIRLVERDGWYQVRTTGSHWHFRHPSKAGTVTLPHPKRDIPMGTARSIYRQAQIKVK